MKRTSFTLLLVFCVIAISYGQPVYKKAIVASSFVKYPSVTPINVGVKGSLVSNFMLYSALNTAKSHPLFSVDGGLAMEWECLRFFSVGLDVSYASRGTKKAFKTEYLIDYHTSDFAYYDYSARIRGLEIFVPLTIYKDVYYPENITFLRNSMSKVYLFVGPELYIPLSGNMDWKRYYSDGSVYSEYHIEATKTSIRDYCYGLGLGFGYWHKEYHTFYSRKSMRSFSTFSISKIDFSCFLESNSLSKPEMDEIVGNVYGWGDLEHESLGKRFGLVFKLTGTFLLPIRYKPSDSCHIDS